MNNKFKYLLGLVCFLTVPMVDGFAATGGAGYNAKGRGCVVSTSQLSSGKQFELSTDSILDDSLTRVIGNRIIKEILIDFDLEIPEVCQEYITSAALILNTNSVQLGEGLKNISVRFENGSEYMAMQAPYGGRLKLIIEAQRTEADFETSTTNTSYSLDMSISSQIL